MAKTHTGKLADRYEIAGNLFLRLRIGNGPTLEVRVPKELRDDAGTLYGNASANYEYRGGKPFFSATR